MTRVFLGRPYLYVTSTCTSGLASFPGLSHTSERSEESGEGLGTKLLPALFPVSTYFKEDLGWFSVFMLIGIFSPPTTNWLHKHHQMLTFQSCIQKKKLRVERLGMRLYYSTSKHYCVPQTRFCLQRRKHICATTHTSSPLYRRGKLSETSP